MLQVGDLAPAFRVQPVFGLPVATGGRPLVVLFLRSLAGGLARTTLAAATRALPRIEAAGGAMVAFTQCDLTLARDIVPREHVLFPIAVEPDDARFKAWGVGRDHRLTGTLPTLLRPAGVRALAGALAQHRGRPSGALDQLGAAFLVGSDGRLRYVEYARSLFDTPDFEALCAAL
jgi:hypothetical protein